MQVQEFKKKVRLTRRQTDLVFLLDRGLSNAEVARALSLAENTIKAQLHTMFKKLGAATRSEAVYLAAEQGVYFPRRKMPVYAQEIEGQLDCAVDLLRDLTEQCARLETVSVDEARILVEKVAECERYLANPKKYNAKVMAQAAV